MGVCCCNFGKENSEAQFPIEQEQKPKDKQNKINNNVSSSPDNNNILSEDIKKENNLKNKKNTLDYNKDNSIDKPDTIDEIFYDNNNSGGSNNIQNNNNIYDNDLNFDLTNMENNLFNLINKIRNDPPSFIKTIQKYKDELKKEDDKYFINKENNRFEFKNGEECFDECINFLESQNKLNKFEYGQTIFEKDNFFMEKNISDLSFVLTCILIDVNNEDENKIRRNCIMSDKYNTLKISIKKEEFEDSLYIYSFYFDTS